MTPKKYDNLFYEFGFEILGKRVVIKTKNLTARNSIILLQLHIKTAILK